MIEIPKETRNKKWNNVRTELQKNAYTIFEMCIMMNDTTDTVRRLLSSEKNLNKIYRGHSVYYYIKE